MSFNVSFLPISGHTVSNNYSWDNGTPFSTASPLVCTVVLPVNDTITGYAPGVKVFVKNTTTLEFNTPGLTSISASYVWNFNDYYNNDNNSYTLSCNADVFHVYIMPGSYNITLTVTQTYLQNFNIQTRTDTTTFIDACVVQEIPPTANFYSVTQPTTGVGTLPLRLTSRTTVPGSFPVDRIVWDFGDGSEQLTVSRYYNLPNDKLINNNIFTNDPDDPRNFDVLHEYNRDVNTYPVFYPSITAYSSSTNTYDACSLTIGPIQLSSLGSDVHILKGRNTPYGNIYTVQHNKDIAFLTTGQQEQTTIATVPTTPPNPIRDTYNKSTLSLGNSGTDYYTVTGFC